MKIFTIILYYIRGRQKYCSSLRMWYSHFKVIFTKRGAKAEVIKHLHGGLGEVFLQSYSSVAHARFWNFGIR